MLTDMILEKEKDIYLSSFGMTDEKLKKKKMIYAVVGTLVTAMLSMVFNMLVFLIPVVAFISYKLPYLMLVQKKGQRDKLNSYLFPEFVDSFMALLPSSGNVYQALRETQVYTSEPLRSQLDTLVLHLGFSNSRDYYMDFADYVGNSDAQMIMDMIYQFSTVGTSEASMKELREHIKSIQENKMDEVINAKMGRMENVGMLPIGISIIILVGFTAVMYVHFMGAVNL